MAQTCGRILLAAAAMCSSHCAMHVASRPQADLGIPVCGQAADQNPLSTDALQCWKNARHGRWRMLNHQSHLEALVVEVEANDLRDAVEIAQRVVADPMADPFTEILVYVARPQGGDELRVRRVRWTRGSGYETLEFSSPAADSPLTVRSSPGNTSAEPHPNP
jgi:hypothetical protein